MSDLKRILDSLGIGYGVYDENDCLLDYNQGSEPEGLIILTTSLIWKCAGK